MLQFLGRNETAQQFLPSGLATRGQSFFYYFHIILSGCIGNVHNSMSSRPVLLLTNLIPQENVRNFTGQMFHNYWVNEMWTVTCVLIAGLVF